MVSIHLLVMSVRILDIRRIGNYALITLSTDTYISSRSQLSRVLAKSADDICTFGIKIEFQLRHH